MSLLRYNRPSMLSFSDLLEGFAQQSSPSIKWANTPRVNVKETENDFQIELAAPGLDKEDFKIEINEGVLRISSEKQQENEELTEKYQRKEFNYTSFSRSFTLPENIDEELISAGYHQGVLVLTLPKAAVKAPKVKTIAVA